MAFSYTSLLTPFRSRRPDALRPAVSGIVVVVVPGPDFAGDLPHALAFARTLGRDVRAVYRESEPARTAAMLESWVRTGDGLPLAVLPSPCGRLDDPLGRYLDSVAALGAPVTVLLPPAAAGQGWTRRTHALRGSGSSRGEESRNPVWAICA